MLEAGTRLGAYVVVAPLGAGGMGEVYLAKDTRLGRTVAVKVLSPQFSQVDDRVRRFELEARAASTLNHPNIVTIHDIGEADGVRFIAMEYVKGRTLRSCCGAPVPLDLVLDWGVQMAHALEAAHAVGIVHRDIKPDNVIVRDDGYVKLLDFGVARLTATDDFDAEAATAAGTSPGTLLGTVRYMAPEQLAGRPATGAADVFALGLLLYELATGQHPAGADTLLALVQALASEEPAEPSRLVPGIPAAFDDCVLRLLAKEESARPAAGAVAQMLTAIRQNAAVAAPMAGPVAIGRPSRPVTVGRERERRLLREALASAIAGRGSLICVAGEPGIGKTTLVEDVLTASAPMSWRVARGRCSERLAGTETYLPWLEAIDSWRRDEHGDAVMQLLRRTAPSWYAQIARGDAAAEDAPVAEVRAVSQERPKRELGLLLEELSKRSPLVLFFDDIHWADASTIDVLAFVATRIADLRLLIVVTYRPTELRVTNHPFLQLRPDLQARGVCRELVLDFLGDQDVAAYIALEYPDHGFPPAFAALIHARTEGNPLFMADLLRDLRDRGVLVRDHGRWSLARPLQAIEQDLPESVRGMIERKIAQLSEDDRQLLVAASVQGYQFDSAIIARAIGVDPAVLEDRLGALEHVHAFVRCLTDEELPDRSLTLCYRFVHVLYQEALYASLRPTRRAALSAAVANALRTAYGDEHDRIAPALATLFDAARDPAQAAAYFLRAARTASRFFASHEAMALARRGLDAVARLPESTMRARLERDLQLAVGWPLINVRGYAAAEVEHAYARARHLHPHTEDPVEPYEALWGLAMCYLARAQYTQTRTLGEEILRLAERTGDAGAFVTGHYMLGTVLFYLGHLVESRDHYDEGIALADREPRVVLPDGRDPGVSCQAQMGRVLWLLGYPDQALAMSELALSRARRAEQPLALVFATFLDMLRRQLSRDVAGTAQAAQTLLALAAEHDLPQYRAWAGIVSGWALAANDPAGGIARMREHLAAYERMGSELSRSHFLALLADALGATGCGDEGLAVIEQALASVERTGERYYLAELYRLGGELSFRSFDAARRDRAAENFRQAIAEARRQQARSWELRAATSLMRAATTEVTKSDAREQLSNIYRSFTEGLDEADAREARALLGL